MLFGLVISLVKGGWGTKSLLNLNLLIYASNYFLPSPNFLYFKYV